MNTSCDCLPCLVQQILDSARLLTDDEALHAQLLRETLADLSRADYRQSPPALAQGTHRRLRELLQNEDPYREIKQRGNAMAQQWLPELQERIRQSPDPLATAVRLAIAGNIIDYGTQAKVEEQAVRETVDRALTLPLDAAALEDFRRSVADATSILYLGDNAGEIFFDRMLIDQLPTEKITFAVRGRPIINDATLADARAAGLTERVRVIDNGADAPGTILEQCSPTFQKAFAHADLVLAKGQGNYETLNQQPKNILFLFMVKCPVVARALGCPQGSIQLRRSPRD